MKKLAAALVASAFALPANAAVILTLGATPAASPTFTFDTVDARYSGPIFTDSVGGVRAKPTGAVDGYAAVGPANGTTSTTLDLTGFGAIDSVSFLWGSIDGYNTLSALGTGFSVTGGEQGLSGEQYVTLTFTGADRDLVSGLQFSSSDNAFEFDSVNVSAAGVPEPATWAMMIGGMGLAGGALRRRRASRTSVSFA